MTTEDDFHALLDANPDDHHTRLVFADFLQERGDPRAEGYRALGELQRMPIQVGNDPCPWFHRSPFYCEESYKLPSDWFDLISLVGKWRNFAPDHAHRTDATRRELEDAAALAFARLPESRRRELLSSPNVTPVATGS